MPVHWNVHFNITLVDYQSEKLSDFKAEQKSGKSVEEKRHMNRRQFIQTMSSGTLGAFVSLKAMGRTKVQRQSRRPNILFLMADDHAANAVGCYGSRLAKNTPTKHIDRLATEGMRMDNCFCTNSLCAPSRATIITGQYSHKTDVYTLVDSIDPQHQNVAKLLQRAGYQTAIIGKWHLKTEPAGFDYWNVLPGQGRYFNPELIEMGKGRREHQGFVSDVIGDLTLQWLENREADKPFCLMTHFKSCHEPWEYPERFEHLFDDVMIPEPQSLWEDKSHRSAGSRDYGFTMDSMAGRMAGIYRGKWPTGQLDISGMNLRQRKRAAYQKFLKDYLRAVAAIDDNVGRILTYLDEHNLTKDTVVMYTSDQGYFLGEHDYIDKRWMYEESLQMPLIVRYPGEINPGTTAEQMIINTDFAPTFLDYAGANIPGDMQGRSFRGILGENPPRDWRTSMYYRYWMHGNGASRPAHYGIRTERYKLIFFYGLPLGMTGTSDLRTMPGWELYDLARDPHELDNVYRDPKYTGVIKELKQELYRLKKELGDTDEKYPELMEVRQQFG